MTDQKVKAKIQLPFNQMPHWLNCRTEINQNAKAIYSTLWGYGCKSGRYFAGIEKLSIDTGLCEKTVFNSLLRLEKLNLIRKCQRGNRQTNEYFFIDSHPWEQEWIEGRDKTYSQVTGKIYESEPETEILTGKSYESGGGLIGKTYDSLIYESLINKQDIRSSNPKGFDAYAIFDNLKRLSPSTDRLPIEVQKQFGKQVVSYFKLSDNLEDSEEMYKKFQEAVSHQDNRIKAICVAAYLNAKYGKQTRFIPASFQHIEARLSEGYSYLDCLGIVDSKASDWGKDPETKQKMWKHLNLETLFRKSKAAKYLAEVFQDEGGI